MSIRRYCRLKAVDRGQALVMGLVLMLVALPMGLYFYKNVSVMIRSAVADRWQKTASEYANSAVMDYFRQFSQDAYNGHYDAASLSRPKTFYAAGYSTVTFTSDEINRTLYVKASGVYGSETKPKTTRVLEALVQFSSDLVKYGTMVNGAFTISASNVNYNGGFYTNGNLTVTGSNIRFNAGPVIVKGNLSGAATVVIDGDLYYSGTSAGSVTVLGQKYNFIPSVTWPTLDFNYYDAHYTYKTTVSQTIILNSTGTFTVVGGATYAIPAKGAIIYAENANLTIRGVVSGRVTVVAGGTVGTCASATGKITVNDSLYYLGASSIAASANASFAALARNCIVWTKSAGDLVSAGVYFVEQGTTNMQFAGGSTGRFYLYGVRSQIISAGSNFTGGRVLEYDANLRSFPPPGLPERALLVNWNQH